jgi:DNA polymerase-3 subunit beta
MKIICRQQDLSRGLAIVNHAVSSRSTLPILANILLATDQGRLRLAATNLEVGITYWLEAEVLEEGEITLQAKLFMDLVNSLAVGPIELSLPADSSTVNIKSPGSNANIKGIEASEFPIIPNADGGEQPIELEATLLKEMITQVIFAAASDDSRPVFTGILVEVGNEKVTFAAADSFRLALRVASLPSQDEYSPILIPAKTLSELARILPSAGTVEMIMTPNRNQVLFHTEQMDLVSQLLEGSFPNVRAAIPKVHATRAVIETKEFAAAVKRVAPFANANIVVIHLEASENDGPGTMTLVSNSEDVGDNTATVNVSTEGPVQEITLSVRYLSQVLAVLDCPEVALEVNSATSPAVIRPGDSTNYVYVIMPMTNNRQ